MEPTVSAKRCSAKPTKAAQATVVADVHEEELHMSPPAKLTVEEESAVPKLSPKIDNEALPLVGAFIGACELSTGAAAARVMHIARDDRPHSAAYRHS
jgi:hypothetical protein